MSSLSILEKHKSNSPELREFYQELLKSTDGIMNEVSQVNLRDPGLIGEGAGSDRKFVTVEFKNPNMQPIHLFAKMEMPENPKHLAITNECKSFEKEMTFFTKYLPVAKQFCVEKGLSETLVTDIYPKCYYGDANMLIMENLREGLNYQILGKEQPHDRDTAELALKTLAEHHAIAYALIKELGGPAEFFQRFPNLDFEFTSTKFVTIMEPWLRSAVIANMKIVEQVNREKVEGASEAILEMNKLLNQSSTVIEATRNSLKVEEGEFVLLNHGDYWYANMLFLKDPESGQVIREKALDFANSRYNSPGVDLGYYLLTCVDTTIRQKYLEELLQHYLSIFNKLCADLGHPVNLTYETLFAQYRRKLYYPLLTSFIARYGPSKEMLKEPDIAGKLGNDDWSETVAKIGEKWVAENPEEAVQVATEIVAVMKEYGELNGV